MSRQPDDYCIYDELTAVKLELGKKDARIEALEAALTEAHRVILHELDLGRTPYLLPVDNGGKGLGYIEDVLAGVKR